MLGECSGRREEFSRVERSQFLARCDFVRPVRIGECTRRQCYEVGTGIDLLAGTVVERFVFIRPDSGGRVATDESLDDDDGPGPNQPNKICGRL